MRKIVLVYLLMIALPAVLVALGGLHLVRREVLRLHQDEQAHAAQAGTRLVARAQKELLETARRLAAEPSPSDDRLVRNTFEWTGQDGLVRPRRETATRAELDFLNRFSGFLTMRQPWLARNAPDEGWKATDHGPHGELLYWRRRGAGRVVGFELRMQEVANRLPPEKPYVADTRPVWLIGGCRRRRGTAPLRAERPARIATQDRTRHAGGAQTSHTACQHPALRRNRERAAL